MHQLGLGDLPFSRHAEALNQLRHLRADQFAGPGVEHGFTMPSVSPGTTALPCNRSDGHNKLK
jgi:hypothetical protein